MPKDPICDMKVNASSGLRLEKDGRAYYFCSEHCMKKFAGEAGMSEEEFAKCSSCKVVPGAGKWYRSRIAVVSGALLFLSLLSYVIPVIKPFRVALWMYIRKIWLAVSAGLLMGGAIDRFIPKEYISKVLARSGKKSIFYSVLLGFFMSGCCHGMLAIAMQLHKKGAPPGAVVSFLLASPWANMAYTLLMFSFFGLKALYIVLGAMLIAIVTGLIFQRLEEKGLIEKNPNTVSVAKDFSIIKDMINRYRDYDLNYKEQLIADMKGVWEGTVALAGMVLWWILIGVGIASIISAYVPSDIFYRFMGPSITGLLVTLVAASLIEVCSEGTAPLAFALFRQTGAFGNSFTFLLAGVVTDYTEIGLIWTNIGRKTALFLPLVTIPQVLLLGFIANNIF